jgi:hypothetical protein
VQDGYMDFNLKKGFTWSGIFTQICKKLKHLNLNFTLNDCVFPFQNIGLHKALGQNTTDTDQADTEITLLCNSSQFHSSKSTQTSQIWCRDSTLILNKGSRWSELTMVSLETHSSLCAFSYAKNQALMKTAKPICKKNAAIIVTERSLPSM